MRALRYDRFGPPDVLHVVDIPEPVPRAGEVKVRVHAASLNPLDWKVRAGHLRWLPMFRRPPRTLGCDFAGEIVGVSAGARSHYVGERVFGSLRPFGRDGALADYLVAGVDRLATMPDGLDYEQAAALPMAGGTALQAIADEARLGAGQRILITGAAGGVGHFAVQIAKHRGRPRRRASAARANADFVRGLGADEVIDYARDDFTRRDDRFDVVFDAASASSFTAARNVLTVDGCYVNTGGDAASVIGTAMGALLARVSSRQRAIPLVLAGNSRALGAARDAGAAGCAARAHRALDRARGRRRRAARHGNGPWSRQDRRAPALVSRERPHSPGLRAVRPKCPANPFACARSARCGRWRRAASGRNPAIWNTCAASGHNSSSTSTPASYALSAARVASSRRSSVLPAWKNSGGKPSKSANSGETSGFVYMLRRRHVVPPQHEQAREPDHRVLPIEGEHARTSQRAVDGRREENGAGRQRLARGAGPVERDQGQVAAGRIAGENDVPGIDPLREQPAVGRVAIVRGSGERILRREPVVGDQRPGAQLPAQPGGERRVRIREAECERPAVQVEDDALVARLRHDDPLARHAAALHRHPLDVRTHPELPGVELLVTAAKRDDVRIVAQRPPHRQPQHRIERPAAPAGRELDLASVSRATAHV